MHERASRHPLFVYGALLEPAERERLLGRRVVATPARLPGYERRRTRYFYVIQREHAEVSGAILAGLSASDLAILDDYEEVPDLYVRKRIDVLDVTGASVECWIYLPTSWAE